MQRGVLLHKGQAQATEVSVPQPPADHTKIEPAAFRDLLPNSDPQHLLLAAAPFSELVGEQVLLLYDANSTQAPNPCATRLTTNLEDGLEVKVCGDAVAFYTRPGLDFTAKLWAELDNCIYSELVTLYQRGQRPSQEELQRIAAEFRAGRFNYERQEGEEDEDANKDDGGESLKESVKRGQAGGGEAGAAGVPRVPSDWRPLVAEGHLGLV